MTILPPRDPDRNFDLALFGLGYERRSVDCFRSVRARCERSIALGYQYFQAEYGYARNRDEFSTGGAVVHEVSDDELQAVILAEFHQVGLSTSASILVDISVMSRHRIAKVIWLALKNLPSHTMIAVSYNVASYVPAPTEIHPIKRFGPIIDELNTVPGRLAMPVSMICGIGYEKDKALGAIGNIDPDELFLLRPISMDVRFDQESDKNNGSLFRTYPGSAELTYDVTRPFSTYVELKSLISRLSERSRVILLPLGPKILTAVAIVLAVEFYPQVVVWRVSSEEKETPLDRESSGTVVQFDLRV